MFIILWYYYEANFVISVNSKVNSGTKYNVMKLHRQVEEHIIVKDKFKTFELLCLPTIL
jgi:hypothetical protein